MNIKSILAAVAAGTMALTSFGVSDETWGEAWNSKIGKKYFTVSASKNGYNGVAWGRGNCACMFDNQDSASADYLEYKVNLPVWVKLVIADDYESGKDVILKKYKVSAGSTTRAPKTWKIYGAKSADATWDDTSSLTLIDSQSNIAGTTKADYDCSGNAVSYRTYFFYFEANNGDNLMQICELFLFGEVKEHEEKIGYSVSTPFVGCYDGYSHGITVAVTYPEEGATVEYSEDNENWQAESPSYKAIGDYTIYYRLTASGFPTEFGSRTISITTPPQKNTSVLAAVRDAEKCAGVVYHSANSVGAESFGTGTEAFVNGIIVGERNGWANGTGYLSYEIDKSYRPGDEITVRSITLSCDASYAFDGSTLRMPRNWKLEAYDAANDDWVELVKYENNVYPEWTDADLVSIGGKNCYQRTEEFENTLVSRKYRFTIISGRTHLGELDLTGDIIMADVSKIQCLSEDYKGTYDGEPHGISVTVQNPEKGYTVSYRAMPDGDWTTTNPTFVDPIPASQAQGVEWKVEAEGYDSVFGTNYIVLAYQDLTAILREAGSEYYSVEATGYFGTVANFVDGNENQRMGWVNGGTFTYVVAEGFETGKAIVVTGLGFAQTYGNADNSYANMPRYFLLEGWNEEAQKWSVIADHTTEPLPEWTEEDKVGDVYRKTADFDNEYSFRKYRLTLPNRRQHTAEIKLFGVIADSALKEIFCTGSDYKGLYDGAEHGITVDVTCPTNGVTIEYSKTGTNEWHTENFTTKGLVSTSCPIYWRVTAEGYKMKTGVNTIQITDKPHTDLDITKTIRAAGKTEYAAWTENGSFAGSAYDFINGNAWDRQGWVNPKTGTGYFGVVISNCFRKAEAIVVKGVVFSGPTNGSQVIDYGKIVLPTVWSIMGSDDGETWETIASYDAENYAAWGADDIAEGLYYRRTDFENAVPYRYYRLGFTGSRTHISEIYLYGDIGKEKSEHAPRRFVKGLIFIVE